ncbi:hypothetical protein BRD00_11355 [Halobacteriales archaeon QS_8_69_26]|nr:MAG: hypothetical protein BRD00_11355 [Halobacteriales archaeon QS_8_69_26]
MRILLDAMCGGLRSYLRMCGHDAAYALDRGVEDDDRLLAWADREERVLVTRDRGLAARADRSVLLGGKAVEDQLRELAAAGVDLTLADPPTRCSRCNGRLDPVTGAPSGDATDEGATDDADGEKAATTPEFAPDPTGTAVWRCVDCGQHFWRGSHWDDVAGTLAAVRGTPDDPDDGV